MQNKQHHRFFLTGKLFSKPVKMAAPDHATRQSGSEYALPVRKLRFCTRFRFAWLSLATFFRVPAAGSDFLCSADTIGKFAS
ncbi:MAG: hypothetical protein HRU77_10430 [Gammaproteobacteria bacterium]|nr:hypothetical protein [Pseudomonadota bacterium]QOJ21072.1 MAG: hypothetical protein HRU77_10430 [Gammaproteobacteria bacterium]